MASGRLLLPGWMPARDSNGEPIPNVSVSFYQNGTDILASVYADSALTIPLTNPVAANSSGRFPQIYASDAITYSASVDAPYGPAGQPFTFDGLQVSEAANIAAANLAQGSAEDAEAALQATLDAIEVATQVGGGSAALAGALAGATAGTAAANVVVAGKADVAGGNLGTSSQAFVQALGSYPTRAIAAAASVVAVLTTITVSGYATTGDWGDPVTYVRTGSNPGNNAGFQTGDGQWWKPAVEFLRPEIFGAKGDNATDDSTAWQNCVNYASTSNLDIKPPSGRTYAIGTVVSIPGGVNIKGAGRFDNGTVFRSTSDTGTVFTAGGDFVNISGVQFRSTAVKTGGAFFEINAKSHCRLDDFYLYHGFIGVDIKGTGAAFNSVTNGFASTFKGATGSVVKIDTDGVGTLVICVRTLHDPADIPLANVYILRCGDVAIVECNLLQAVNSLYVSVTTGKTASSVTLVGGYLDSSSCGFRAEATGGSIVRFGATGTWFGGGSLIAGGGNGVILRNTGGGVCEGYKFVGCRVPLVNNGIDFDAGTKGVEINSTTFCQNGGTAVLPGTGATRFSVTGCLIGADDGLLGNGVGISIPTGCDQYRITNNTLIGNTTNYVNNSASATTREISGNIGIPNELRIGSGLVSENYTFSRDNGTGNFRATPDQNTFNGYDFRLKDNLAAVRTGLSVTAPAANETAAVLLVNIGGTFTAQRVTVGATDSGGSGFRLLRVPN